MEFRIKKFRLSLTQFRNSRVPKFHSSAARRYSSIQYSCRMYVQRRIKMQRILIYQYFYIIKYFSVFFLTSFRSSSKTCNSRRFYLSRLYNAVPPVQEIANDLNVGAVRESHGPSYDGWSSATL
ncbi:hypothetical protein ANTRET_LOCUS3074 [Anthophora retusa]